MAEADRYTGRHHHRRTTCCTTATPSSPAAFARTTTACPCSSAKRTARRWCKRPPAAAAKFFLGTDSAPHPAHLKEHASGCAGCYTAHAAIEMYAEAFDNAGALDKLEGFASFHGPAFYGLPRNRGTITLRRESWTPPDELRLRRGRAQALRAGEALPVAPRRLSRQRAPMAAPERQLRIALLIDADNAPPLTRSTRSSPSFPRWAGSNVRRA